MTEKTIKLSATGRAMLTQAVTREDRLVPPPKLPVAAARQVVRSLTNTGLLEEVAVEIDDPALTWRIGDDGIPMILRATTAGIEAVSEGAGTSGHKTLGGWTNRIEPASLSLTALVEQVGVEKPALEEPPASGVTSKALTQDVVCLLDQLVCREPRRVLKHSEPARMVGDDFGAASPAGVVAEQIMAGREEQGADRKAASSNTEEAAAPPRRRLGLRPAAETALAAWQALGGPAVSEPLLASLQALRGALRPVTPPGRVGRLREETKQARVLAMLGRPEGATVAQIAEAMAWQPHTVRGFLAGVAKKGITIEVLDRVRQVGPNKVGAKGSYTVYRLAEATKS